MTSITVVLPWPDSALSPNSRKRWDKINATKSARLLAKITALASERGAFGPEPISIFYGFSPPDNRARDDDNMIGSCKAYRDGIFDALGINDKQSRAGAWQVYEAQRGGRVVIAVTQ